MKSNYGKHPPVPKVVNYGATTTDDDDQFADTISKPSFHAGGEGDNSRRRSTVSTVRQSMAKIADQTREALRSHTMSSLALCSSVLSMMYLLMSAFPYSGFMAMQLIPGLTQESAGTYAGILSGSFMIGRLFSAYPWGMISDRYGRKFVLLFSTASSAILVVTFGFSFSFPFAVCIRFFTGICNGTMIAARVSVTELAKGNHDLEARGMGLVMSMVGFGMLMGPAIGGVLSEPVTQHPDIDFGRFEDLLLKFPFLLPNLIGGLLCTLSTLQIIFSVEETLPKEKLRSPKYFLPDAVSLLAGLPSKAWINFKSRENGNDGDGEYERIKTPEATDTTTDDEDMKIIESRFFGEMGDAVAMSTRSSRASFSAALHRPSATRPSLGTLEEGEKETFPDSVESSVDETRASATISSLMGNKRVRECLTSYWCMTFASTAAGEVFPLFAMARKPGGLGVEETAIGVIGAGSGLLFCVSQYFIFAASMKRLGLHKTMVYSAFLSVTPAILIPLSLLIDANTGIMAYLSVLNGIMLIFFSNWNAALTITQNRAVNPSERAKLNGLAAVGASVGRGGGPLFAGVLVTLSYTSGVVPAAFGSLLVYVAMGLGGLGAYILTSKLEDDEEK
mmetsp:Transcript_14531/g.34799  ORF Transcript_14531/g.34799 Transcript_14531/m.34799 type:complete len:619 (-) Transcript_14531:1342-3198(-)|eukprot:CAMPEP_0185806252 /NCGR_PEP_ID=MMETSP1322-20130828/4330_1 /TAXON_ID=265543 /ORGANISM="Minutocellus polymorphus, Strain RCC2270" /LENGTH=618 /DNA_ID=CAMNT_0028502337 /DNA_START=77 /DNA_END=1933 /DNA_ORIENTATION=-